MPRLQCLLLVALFGDEVRVASDDEVPLVELALDALVAYEWVMGE